MKNLYIYCEGFTEESFVNSILYPYLMNAEIYVSPIVCVTKRTGTSKFKGGISSYKKIRDELLILCKQHKNEAVTTMFDYYGLPGNTPGFADASGDFYNKVLQIERAVEADIRMPNLFFSLTVHEFEGLLFSDTSAFGAISDSKTIAKLQAVRDKFASPEHINNSVDTAPSKRLIKLIPGYAKTGYGTILSGRIGIEAMLSECQHFREWISKIISWPY